MRKNCLEARDISKGVVAIYLKLASLAKENKQKSEEYFHFLSLLSKAKEIEKRNYSLFKSSQEEREETFRIIAETPKDGGYFLPQTIETLAAIRALNQMDSHKIYALDGILKYSEGLQNVQEYLNEAFYYEISKYLEHSEEKDREPFIDAQYAILAASPMIEEECLAFPKPNNTLTREEMHASLNYLMPKVQFLTNRLLDIYDDELNADTILLVLYTKACISLLPSINQHATLEEFKNAIDLNRLLGAVTGRKNKKTCDLLSSIYEEERVPLSK